MEKEKRENFALLLAHKRTERYGWYKNPREQNCVAGQLRDMEGNQLFPNKLGKKEFNEFLKRCQTGEFKEGDGGTAVALVLFHFRQKMRRYKEDEKMQNRFVPGLTAEEVVGLIENEDLSDLGLNMSQKLELAQFAHWLKEVTYTQVARV